MANFLDSLGIGGEIDVYVTVSPSCGLEMTTLDSNGEINTYAQLPLEYNEVQREIANYENFKDGLEQLFAARNINPRKAKVHLSLPSVWMGLKQEVQLILGDEAVNNIVLGELEKTYIFKRRDPHPYWFEALGKPNAESRDIFYTAIQEDLIDKFTTIFKDMGASLVSIGNGIIADIKGLYVTGIAASQMNDDESIWNLMIVDNSGYRIIGMRGKNLVEFYEEPLPIKSYEDEEIYTAIENAAQIALMSTVATSLVILSETNLVSAEVLANNLQFSGEKIFVEDNKFRTTPLIDMGFNIVPEDQAKVSLHMLGLIASENIIPTNVDFMSGGNVPVDSTINIPLGNGKIFKLTPHIATIIAAAFLIIVLIPAGMGLLISGILKNNATAASNDLESKITAVNEELKAYNKSNDTVQFDPVGEIERVLKYNRTKIMSYAALGESIPQNLYLTYFMTGNEGFIDIKGCADSVEDVYVFFKNLKDSLIESNLRLNKLDLKANSLDSVVNSTVSSVDNAPYVFEITNMSDSQLSTFMKNVPAAKGGDAKVKPKASEEETLPEPMPDDNPGLE